MKKNILNTDIQNFISNNLHSDISKLILKGSPFEEITVQELANQIVAKKKSETKLPTWFQTKNIYYPEKVSIEQTSSEITAAYKSTLVKGERLIDLSGGFGIDDYFFAKQFKQVTHCELNAELSEIVTHNYQQLNVTNIKCIHTDGIEFLKNNETTYDCIYIDPSRRDSSKNKVFLLEDCSPDVPKNIDLLFAKANTILIKTSPILDITATLRELKFTKEIHIVAIDNEVKELLFLLEKECSESTTIKTVNIKKNDIQNFDFIFSEKSNDSKYSEPKRYLYEPNAAILKSGGFHELTKQFNISKLHQHTHLYTSEELVDFPGRCFEIEQIAPYNKKVIKKIIPQNKANISIRNFPKTVAQLRKETKIKDGGDLYIFFTTIANNNKVLIVNKKINQFFSIFGIVALL